MSLYLVTEWSYVVWILQLQIYKLLVLTCRVVGGLVYMEQALAFVPLHDGVL